MRWSLFIVPVLLSCSSATEPRDDRVLASIAGYVTNDPQIEIVASGRRATVRVTSYGNGCYSAGPTESSVQGMVALVTPYDVIARGDFACPDILRQFVHETVVQFPASGSATIRIRGQRWNMAIDPPRTDTITVERVIVLQ